MGDQRKTGGGKSTATQTEEQNPSNEGKRRTTITVEDQTEQEQPVTTEGAVQAPTVAKVRYRRFDDAPTVGLPRLLWFAFGWIYTRRGWDWILRLTRPRPKEHFQRLYVELQEQRLNLPFNAVNAAEKGGACKTQGASDDTLALGYVTQQDVTYADLNVYGNHGTPRLHIDSSAHSVCSLLVEDSSPLESHAAFCRAIKSHPTDGLRNVRGITFDNGIKIKDPDLEKVSSLVKALFEVSHTVEIDGGQDLTSNWMGPVLEAVDIIKVHCLVGQLGSARDALHTLKEIEKIDPDYINKCVLIVHAHRGKVTLITKRIYAVEHDKIVKEEHEKTGTKSYLNVPVERTFVVPYDPELDDAARKTGPKDANRSGLGRPMDFRNYKLATQIAILEYLIELPYIADSAAKKTVKSHVPELNPQ